RARRGRDQLNLCHCENKAKFVMRQIRKNGPEMNFAAPKNGQATRQKKKKFPQFSRWRKSGNRTNKCPTTMIFTSTCQWIQSACSPYNAARSSRPSCCLKSSTCTQRRRDC